MATDAEEANISSGAAAKFAAVMIASRVTLEFFCFSDFAFFSHVSLVFLI